MGWPCSPQGIDQKLLTSFPTISWADFVTGRVVTGILGRICFLSQGWGAYHGARPKMKTTIPFFFSASLLCAASTAGVLAANTNQTTPASPCAIDARMLRYPDVSANQIAFVYAGDIWVAPK